MPATAGAPAASSAIGQVTGMEQFKRDVLGRPGKTVVDFLRHLVHAVQNVRTDPR